MRKELRQCHCDKPQTAIVTKSSNSFCSYCYYKMNGVLTGVSGKDSGAWLKSNELFTQANLERIENELLYFQLQYKESGADNRYWKFDGKNFVKTQGYTWGSTNRHTNVRTGLHEMPKAVREEQKKAWYREVK